MQTILLIQDDPANLIAQSMVLRSLGYTVLESASRAEAWRALQKYQRPIQLVVANATLDNHRTSDFIARLRLACPQTRFLFVSEASNSELAGKPRTSREFAFLQKPFPLESFTDVIRDLLDEPKKRAASHSHDELATAPWPHPVIAANAAG